MTNAGSPGTVYTAAAASNQEADEATGSSAEGHAQEASHPQLTGTSPGQMGAAIVIAPEAPDPRYAVHNSPPEGVVQ